MPPATDPFAPEVVAAVVAHMVEDHADDSLRIARVLGGAAQASAARLRHLDRAGLVIEVVLADRSTSEVRVPWETVPVDRRGIRLEMVRLAEQARGGEVAT